MNIYMIVPQDVFIQMSLPKIVLNGRTKISDTHENVDSDVFFKYFSTGKKDVILYNNWR